MTDERLLELRKSHELRTATADEVNELFAYIDELRADVEFEMGLTDQAVKRLQEREGRSRCHCQWCGWKSEFMPHEEAEKLIIEHVAVCEKHPIAAVRAERDAWKKVAECCGADMDEAEKLMKSLLEQA
jgi:hypothetical protein